METYKFIHCKKYLISLDTRISHYPICIWPNDCLLVKLQELLLCEHGSTAVFPNVVKIMRIQLFTLA